MDSKEVLITVEELRNRLFDLFLIVASYTECDTKRKKGLELMFKKCYLGIIEAIEKKSNALPSKKTQDIVLKRPSLREVIKIRIGSFLCKVTLWWRDLMVKWKYLLK